MAAVLGRTVRYLRPSEKDYLRQLAEDGAPQGYIDVQRMNCRVVRLNVSAFPNHSVRKLTGEPATTFERFVRYYRDVWTTRASGRRLSR